MAAGTHRILVVDDDTDVREVLTRFFTQRGHDVRDATDGRQGVAMMRVWPPDIVLLDLEMPEMNGLEVLRQIIADHSEVSVIAVSGHPAGEILGKDAKRLGAREFVAKPIDLEQLDEIVADILGGGES